MGKFNNQQSSSAWGNWGAGRSQSHNGFSNGFMHTNGQYGNHGHYGHHGHHAHHGHHGHHGNNGNNGNNWHHGSQDGHMFGGANGMNGLHGHQSMGAGMRHAAHEFLNNQSNNRNGFSQIKNLLQSSFKDNNRFNGSQASFAKDTHFHYSVSVSNGNFTYAKDVSVQKSNQYGR